MKLKFICAEGFDSAGEICNRMQGYLPNLIGNIEIVRSKAFQGIFETWHILAMIERMVKPDWDNEIVLVVIYGSLYFGEVEMYDAVACTLDYLPSRDDAYIRGLSERPKLGGQLLPNNMSEEPRGDVEYWAKLGVEEILHYFGIPKQHDENCFFHAKEFGKGTVEDCWKDYCPKCREFMRQLEDPLDFGKLFVGVEEIYELKPKPGRRWKEILGGHLRHLSSRVFP